MSINRFSNRERDSNMSFFSRSSKRSHYKHGSYGSSHYQKKGLIGNLLNIFASRSSYGGHYNKFGNKYNNATMDNQPQSNECSLTCSKCSSKIPVGSKFCLECGQKVSNVTFCANCGESIQYNSKFCMKCGNKLK